MIFIFAVIFIIAAFLVFFVPGFFVLKSFGLQISKVARVVLSVAIGMSFWGIQAYVFGYLHLRWLTFSYVFACIVLLFRFRKDVKLFFSSLLTSLHQTDKISLALLLIGVFLQSLQMFGSGINNSNGMAFFRVHSQDGIYHLSLISSLVRQFPPIEPGASGIAVSNYHYWSDLMMADLSRIFAIPIQTMFFQYVPVLISLFTALAIVSLVNLWKGNKYFLRFALFFLFFGADAGYIIAYLIHHVFSFQYPVIDNGATQFLNMPHAFAKFVFLCQIYSLGSWIRSKRITLGMLTGLFTAVLFGLKIYFALFAVIGLSIVACLLLLQKNFKLFLQFVLIGTVTMIGALLIYLPPNKASGGLAYYPLEWPKLILSQDNLDWRDWRYKRAVAELVHSNVKVVFYDIEAIVITLIAIHGTRVLGFMLSNKVLRQLGREMTCYMLLPSLIFTFLGLYTLQVSGSFNVFNFFAMSLSVLALVTALHVSIWWESKNLLLKLIVVIIIVLTLPRIFFETQKIIISYQTQTDVKYISREEQLALYYISKHFAKDCIVSSSPENELDMKTPYVSFFSNREAYMSGQGVLETHNAPTLERYQEFKSLFSSHDVGKISVELKANHICALYLKSTDTLAQNHLFRERIVYVNKEAMVIDLR